MNIRAFGILQLPEQPPPMKNKSGLFGLSSPMSSFTRACAPAKLAGLALIASAALGTQAHAAVTFTGTDGGTRSASAEFSVSGDTLSIRLTNTSTFDVTAPDQLLSSVYFSFLSGSTPALTKTGGGVALDGSQIYYNGVNVTAGPYGGGGNVSGEYAFKSGLTGGVLGSDTFFGVSSNGMGAFDFGTGDRFSNVNLHDPDAPNGMNYGISSFGDIVSTYNGGIGDEPIINYSVLITLKGASGLDLSKLDGVRFQYGTDHSNPNFAGTPTDPNNPINVIPEPGSTAALMGLLSCGLFLRSRRTRTA